MRQKYTISDTETVGTSYHLTLQEYYNLVYAASLKFYLRWMGLRNYCTTLKFSEIKRQKQLCPYGHICIPSTQLEQINSLCTQQLFGYHQ